MTAPALEPRSAFAHLSWDCAPGRGVIASDRKAVGLASVHIRNGQMIELRTRVSRAFELTLPDGPRRAAAGDVAFIGTGVGAWLASFEGADPHFAAKLRHEMESCASVTDQTGALGLLRLTGTHIRSALAKLIPVDLHPQAFGIGAAATTLASQVRLHLWRLQDSSDGLSVFEMAIPRSLCASFWHALTQSAAEFGFEFSPG